MKKLPGTFLAKKKDGTIYYRSSFTYRNKHISLGSFSTALLAHTAYKEALRLVSTPSLTLFDYQKEFTLSFEKYVILLNFRDNGLYFPTPIYMRLKYFSYYLNPHTELKFSIDDLFYYASHKIMCRGGHYFVADYGMQVNILNRYGIKNYAVYGKDYVLLNQDPLDFRYENIQILNPYHGVSRTSHYGTMKYQAKIHLHGDYIIGYYDSALEAAIAYNKAIDLVQKNGCQKNFKQNYTEGITPSVYAEIYSKVSISPKIEVYLAE
ncbi:MAG: hypothetical protein ACI39N_07045 [Lachnospiraceae bacterium]